MTQWSLEGLPCGIRTFPQVHCEAHEPVMCEGMTLPGHTFLVFSLVVNAGYSFSVRIMFYWSMQTERTPEDSSYVL